MGPLNDLDRAFITTKCADDYIKKMDRKHKQKSLLERFSNIKDQRLVDILQKLLQFNPGFRHSASDCLDHELFAKFRKDKKSGNKGEPVIESELYADD